MIAFLDRHRLASWTVFYVLLAIFFFQMLELREEGLPFGGSPVHLLVNSIPTFLLTVFVVPLCYLSSIAWRKKRGLPQSTARVGRRVVGATSGLIALAWVAFLAWLVIRQPAA